LAGGRTIHIPLSLPSYGIDWDQVAQAMTAKTRAIIINNPHNPTGSVLSADDIHALQRLIDKHDCYLIADEVYEHITFDGLLHQSILRYPELASRAFVISSFGKSFHVTGWKVGYCVAPERLTAEFRKIHQFVTFSTTTPMQKAIADALMHHPELITELSDFYQEKRDLLLSATADSPFKMIPCRGTYFQLFDYSAISDQNDLDFSHWLTTTHKIATIPLSPFYQTAPQSHIIRICFAKDNEMLIEAAEILCQL